MRNVQSARLRILSWGKPKAGSKNFELGIWDLAAERAFGHVQLGTSRRCHGAPKRYVAASVADFVDVYYGAW